MLQFVEFSVCSTSIRISTTVQSMLFRLGVYGSCVLQAGNIHYSSNTNTNLQILLLLLRSNTKPRIQKVRNYYILSSPEVMSPEANRQLRTGNLS